MPTALKSPRLVHVVSHGPHCLDGVAAAVAVARYHSGIEVRPRFSGNPKIDEVIRGLDLEPPLADQELWITDISWTDPATDRFLRGLAEAGLSIFWIDHHKTAIERVKQGRIDVPFAERIVDDSYSAARLVFDHLSERLRREGRRSLELERFAPIVRMADDNDRWLHEVAGSWDLALTVRAMDGPEAFDELMRIDERGTYTPRMRAAFERVETELKESLALADRTRHATALPGGPTVVAAVCNGYPSEIADRWGKTTPDAVFVLFDLKSGAVSYRRSPDCAVDLSRLAAAFGGGGHPAAAGSEMRDLLGELAAAAGKRVADAVGRLRDRG